MIVPGYSNSTPYLTDLARALSKRGVGVTLAKTRPRGESSPLIDVVRGRERPDILHLQFTRGFVSDDGRTLSVPKTLRFIADLVRLKLAGVRLCWTVHDMVTLGPRDAGREHLALEALAALCDVVFVQSEAAAAFVRERYGKRIPVERKIAPVARGNYIGDYPNTIGRDEARTALNVGPARFVLAFFGKIARYKGVDRLVSAFRRMDLDRATLLIAGQMSMKLDLRRTEGRDIRVFPGFVPVDEVQVYMNAADVVVLPYRHILNSGPALIAMGFAKPVIAPRISSLPELLDEHANFLYDPDEEDGLVGAIGRSAAADLPPMGRHNYERALLFDWDRVAEKTVEAYASLLPAARSRRLDPAGGYIRGIEY